MATLTWKPFEAFGIVIYSFEGEGSHQLSVSVGDLVHIEEEFGGLWYRGAVVSDNKKGIFPCNHIQVKGEVDLVVNELTQVLREWQALLKKKFLERKMSEYISLKERILVLLEWYHKIMSPSTTDTKKQELKDRAISKIEEGRRMMGLDMIVRTESGEPAGPNNTPLLDLYKMHQELGEDKKAPVPHNSEKENISLQKSTSSTNFYQKSTSQNNILQKAGTLETNLLNHLLLDLRVFMCSVGETTEVFFSIYNKSTEKFITEEFRVLLTGQGMPFDVNKIGKLKSVFIDLSSRELQQNLYVVCKLVRRGKLEYAPNENKKDKKAVDYRRPFGCAVLGLSPSEFSKILNQETEYTVPIYSPVQETQFHILHELIIKKNFQSIQEVPRAKGVCLGLTLYNGEYNQLVSNVPELKEIGITNRLGFSEVFLPGIDRNDFYITIEEGEFSQDRKTSAKNVEVTLQARKENGDVVKDVLFLGSGDAGVSEFRSSVLYHSNAPKWNETIRMKIPDCFEQVHLYANVRHCSTSESKEKGGFANAFIKLVNNDGTVIKDGSHALECFKPPKNNNDPLFYMKGADKLSIRKGEQLKIKTSLSSTKLTQNSALLNLLRWKTYTGNLGDILNQFTYVDQLEIIKFLQEIFDAMFAILDEKTQDVAILVYNSIVFIIGILVDEKKRYASFRPVLDTYIDKHFKGTTAHKHLMACVKHYFDQIATNPNQISKLIPTLKSLQYVFKFIIASRMLFNRNQQSDQDVWFKKDLLDVLEEFNRLMANSSPSYIGAQTTAIKNFSSMFQDLGQVFDTKELSSIASKFVESVHYSGGQVLLNMEKLQLLYKLVCSDLFLQEESREILLPMVLRQLKKHVTCTSRDEVLQCTRILGVMINLIQTKIQGTVIHRLLPLLPELMQAIQTMTMMPDVRLDIITCLLSIFYLMEPSQFELYVKSIETEEVKSSFLALSIKLLKVFLSTRTYPENWFAMIMFQYSTIRKVILILSNIVQERKQLLSNMYSNELQLWHDLVQLCILYIRASVLALETVSESKQNMIKESSGGTDMRIQVSEILMRIWKCLDKAQNQLLQSFVGPFLELMLIKQKNIKQMAVDLYFSLLEREYLEDKCFARVEVQTIDTLDKIANEGLVDEDFQNTFTSLESRFTDGNDFHNKGKLFLNDMKQLLSLLHGLRNLPAGKEYEDERTIATMKLMEYLKQTDRRSTYIKYVHMLCDQHLGSSNFTEAGLTVLLHADLLTWSDDLLEEQGDFPAETNRQRKEKLMKMAIEYLDKGKLWEKAIELIRELRVQYEEVIFDFQKLADILTLESTFFRKISGTERFFSPHFRVGYYGRGFDPSIAGKEFIYKGFELERISDFIARITAKFPNAQLLTYTEPPPNEIITSEGQYLQIHIVKPSSVDEMEGRPKKINKKMPPALQKYHNENNVNVFVYSRPFKKAKSNPPNEFRDLWLCNTYYLTNDQFPTIHRRSEIGSTREVEVSPIDNAFNTVVEKNKELLEIITKHEKKRDNANISPFTMVLKGVIDAGVNGGVDMYRSAFFSPDFLAENPSKKDAVVRLQECLNEQLDILDKGLGVHAKICPEDLGALQEQLNKQFTKMKSELKDYLQASV